MFQNKVLKQTVLYLLMVSIVSCKVSKSSTKETKSTDTAVVEKISNKVLIETSVGNITIELYDETPKHRDNFKKLVKDSLYNGTLFHRVIKNFMIQGGDPDSKIAIAGAQLGNGGPGYTIEAEIIDTIFHKKGALCAARQGDQVNPEKRSSGSQFYIVTGKTYTKEELQRMEDQINASSENALLQKFIQSEENKAYAVRLQEAQTLGQNPEKRAEAQQLINELLEEIKPLAMNDSVKVKFTESQMTSYSTIGGTPHLDRNYTVFGEVIEGLDIVEKIEVVKGDRANRPLADVKIISMKIVE